MTNSYNAILFCCHTLLSPSLLSFSPRFSAICPKAMSLFGFKCDGKVDLSKSEMFIMHAKKFVTMLDSAVDMLGPNLDMLTDILTELGQKHAIKYLVKPEYFPPMGIALLESLQEVDKEFTLDIQKSWRVVYTAISADMIKWDSN